MEILALFIVWLNLNVLERFSKCIFNQLTQNISFGFTIVTSVATTCIRRFPKWLLHSNTLHSKPTISRYYNATLLQNYITMDNCVITLIIVIIIINNATLLLIVSEHFVLCTYNAGIYRYKQALLFHNFWAIPVSLLFSLIPNPTKFLISSDATQIYVFIPKLFWYIIVGVIDSHSLHKF